MCCTAYCTSVDFGLYLYQQNKQKQPRGITLRDMKQFILNATSNGQVGVETMELYDQGVSVAKINRAIRELIADGKIEISSPFTGWRLDNTDDEKTITRTLYSKNFAIYPR